MTSPEQFAANRANAQHSTGPRTEEGKAASARNATRHNLCGRFTLLDGENKLVYAELAIRYLEDLQPVGILEEQLVETIHDSQWRLNRVRGIEEKILLDAAEGCEAALTTVCRYEAAIQRLLFKSLAELRTVQKLRDAQETEDAQFALENKTNCQVDEKTDAMFVRRVKFGFVREASAALDHYRKLEYSALVQNGRAAPMSAPPAPAEEQKAA